MSKVSPQGALNLPAARCLQTERFGSLSLPRSRARARARALSRVRANSLSL